MPQLGGGRVLVTSNDWQRQRLHSNFKNAPWAGKNEGGPQVVRNENRTARYFAMVSADTEMRLWTCGGLHRGESMIFQSRMKELGRVSVARLVKIPPYSAIVASRDIFHVASAWCSEDTEGMSTAGTARYHVHFAKMPTIYRPQSTFSPTSRPRF